MEVGEDDANALLAAIPVRAAERVEVPFLAVRQWASGQRPDPVSDVDTVPDTQTRPREERRRFQLLVWKEEPTSGGRWRWIDAEDLHPGDQVVVPAERGGLDEYGWNPASTLPVGDVSEAAALEVDRPLLRLDTQLAQRLGLPPSDRQRVAGAVNAITVWIRQELDPGAETGQAWIPKILGEEAAAVGGQVDELVDPTGQTEPSATEDPQHGLIRVLREALAADADTPAEAVDQGVPGALPTLPLVRLRPRLRTWLSDPTSHPRILPVLGQPEILLDGGTPRLLTVVLTGRLSQDSSRAARKPAHGTEATTDALNRDDDDVLTSSIGYSRVTLERHLTKVRARAEDIAGTLRLPDDLRRVLADAAGWHDLGKVEDRFQAMLHGGDPYEALVAAEPLAKSGIDPQDRAARQIAHRRSGLPTGARHEAWSTALIAHYLRQRADSYEGDTDLLLHLIASHHGHARPLLPPVINDAPRPVEVHIDNIKIRVSSEQMVDLKHPARFARLNERYGRWGLALLEAVVRCADITVSAEGS